jgi:hypothetical protein
MRLARALPAWRAAYFSLRSDPTVRRYSSCFASSAKPRFGVGLHFWNRARFVTNPPRPFALAGQPHKDRKIMEGRATNRKPVLLFLLSG